MELISKKFKKAISEAKNIIITTHAYPDADGIGSEISLCLALSSVGKNCICCNDEELLERYKYLDPQNKVVSVDSISSSFKESPDLVIVVDTNTISRTGEKFQKFYKKYNCEVLYIDHHPCHISIDENHCIDTSAAATGQLVGELIENVLGVSFTPEIALPLYTAIIIDTSSFRYPTVTAKTHEIIAKLMATGIEPPRAYNGIYGTKKIEHMHLLGHVLSSADSTENEEIAWITLSSRVQEKFDVDIEDTHGFINNLLILDNVKVACMFRDDGDQVKVSLRSSGQYDVGAIAINLGGGGHSHSAATIIKKSKDDNIKDIIKITVSKIEASLKS